MLTPNFLCSEDLACETLSFTPDMEVSPYQLYAVASLDRAQEQRQRSESHDSHFTSITDRMLAHDDGDERRPAVANLASSSTKYAAGGVVWTLSDQSRKKHPRHHHRHLHHQSSNTYHDSETRRIEHASYRAAAMIPGAYQQQHQQQQHLVMTPQYQPPPRRSPQHTRSPRRAYVNDTEVKCQQESLKRHYDRMQKIYNLRIGRRPDGSSHRPVIKAVEVHKRMCTGKDPRETADLIEEYKRRYGSETAQHETKEWL